MTHPRPECLNVLAVLCALALGAALGAWAVAGFASELIGAYR